MAYRTRTYIAGDWDGDKNLIDTIYSWKKSTCFTFDFLDAHELSQSYDSSKPCSIKKNLAVRMDASKTFVLIVGKNTITVTKGSCRWCDSYDTYHRSCHAGGYVDYRSFIDFECEKASRDPMKIVVIYNYASVDKSKCPSAVRYLGTHIPAIVYEGGTPKWNYPAIKNAIMG